MERQFGAVRFIPGPNSGKYPHCHSVYVEGQVKVLIDPAADRERLTALRDGPGVDQVWLTHSHEDHITHLDLFEDRELGVHPMDAPALGDLETFLDYYDMTDPEIRGFWAEILVKNFNYKPRTPDRLFADDETVDLGGAEVRILHAPGHTPGHTAFFFPDEGVLFLADYDLTPFGPWYGDRYSSIEDTIASVRRLRDLPARVWLTCHEDGLFETEPGPLWDRYLAVIDDRESRLLELLRTPRAMAEVIEARLVYRKKKEPAAFFDFGERAIMGKHLERLIGQGRVVEDRGVYALV